MLTTGLIYDSEIVRLALYEPDTQHEDALLIVKVTGIETEPFIPSDSEISITAVMSDALRESIWLLVP